MPHTQYVQHLPISGQRGASLIIVMMVLTVVSLLGIAGIQIATMSERGARNDRDMQIAWQAAEAALIDAEFDIYGPGTVNASRRAIFKNSDDISSFVPGCGNTAESVGLCTLVDAGKPAWLTVDFTNTSASARTAVFGQFTNRSFASGSLGIQPSKPPRYIIEPIPDPERDKTSGVTTYIYRVTAMGFGPRDDIQAVLQMVYRY